MCGWAKDAVQIVTGLASVAGAASSMFQEPPKAAKVTIPTTPKVEDTSVQQAADKERRRLLLARGQKSTNVTKGLYADDSALLVSPALGGR